MNEREESNELIRRIAETLRNHTEPYQEGAWERFAAGNAEQGRKRRLWPYWSAAASILLAMGLFWQLREWRTADDAKPMLANSEHTVEQTDEMPGSVPVEPGARVVPDVGAVHTSEPSDLSASLHRPIIETAHLVLHQSTDVPAGIQPDSEHTVADAVGGSPADRSETEVVDTREVQLVDPGPTVGRATEPVYAITARNRPESLAGKWDLGLVVSPSITSEQVNWGGGIAVAYRLSDKFSVGSGVSIGRLGLGQNADYNPGSLLSSEIVDSPTVGGAGFVADAREYRQELSVTSSVVALDVPFDLRYEVTRGFYASVGISYVAILNEQRTSYYVDGLNERTLTENHTGYDDLDAAVTAVFASEEIAAQPLKGKGYAGFVNFSVGRKVSLSSKLSIGIEPYFKLPVGRLSREDMDFTNGGIRIVTGF